MELTLRQKEFYTDHKNEWVALLYQPKSQAVVRFSETLDKLLDDVSQAYPAEWEFFAYRQLLSPSIGLYEGH